MLTVAGGFKVDLEDPRFRDMFTSHHFALDPTDPRYVRSDATEVGARRAGGCAQQPGHEKLPGGGRA